ncbi:MAG: glutaredoxin family protein [Propionibacteriaceae bacterium]|nr:glutaredoxin family protein [Propionibacteriaceae bacterium]
MIEARVVLLVRDGCHLCDEAVAVVSAVCAGTGDTWTTRDVDADDVLRAEFSDHVPVTFVDGVRHAIWHVDADALRRVLAGTP